MSEARVNANGPPVEITFRQETVPVSKPRTVRVRILVAVDDKAHWASSGYYSGPQAANSDPKEWIALDDLSEVIRYSWIEADIPLPEPEATIAGEVKDDAI